MANRTSFSSLPVELATMIVNLVHPDAIVSLACTCKGIKFICEARLAEHRAMSKRYGRVVVGEHLWSLVPHSQYSGATHFNHALRLLYEIDKDPFVAYYIKDLSYCQEDYEEEIDPDDEDSDQEETNADGESYDQEETDSDDESSGPDEIKPGYEREWYSIRLPDILLQTCYFTPLIDRVPILQKDQHLKTACKDSMVTGNPHACMMLILSLSDNLRRLQTCDELDPGAWVRSARNNECQFLCGLREIFLRMHEFEWHLEPPVIQNWTGISSLQTLVCHRIDDHDDTGLLLPAPAPRALPSLTLVGGLGEEGVSAVISLFKDLQYFAYLFDVHVDNGIFDYDISMIIQALENVALKSIETIVLRFYGCPAGQPLNMTRFENLTHFDGQLNMLDLEVSDAGTYLMLNLRSTFPATLSVLSLETWECWYSARRLLRCPLYPWTTPVPLMLKGLDQCPKLKDIKLSSGRLSSATAHELLERGATVKFGKLPDPLHDSI